jgi:cytochrome P450
MYAHLREEDPIAKVRMPSGDQAFLITQYEDVRTVLSDTRFSRAATLEDGAPRLAAAPQKFKSLLNMDPPEHTRVRKLVSREFTPAGWPRCARGSRSTRTPCWTRWLSWSPRSTWCRRWRSSFR